MVGEKIFPFEFIRRTSGLLRPVSRGSKHSCTSLEAARLQLTASRSLAPSLMSVHVPVAPKLPTPCRWGPCS